MFGIGLAPKSHNTLAKVLLDKGYSLTDASDIGLVKSNNDGYYDYFHHRIMFPIIDDLGHVLGFSARIFYKDDNSPKYLNTEETVIYKKGEMLYNLNNAIPHIRKSGRVILCEGQMDVISMSNAGVKDVICSLGTALTAEQAALLSKYTKNVTICYDGDAAGIKATAKAFNVLKAFTVNSVTLPNKMDPDEYIKNFGKDEFLKYIKENQKDVFAFLYFNAFTNRNLSVAYDYEEVKKTVFSFLFKSGSTSLIEKYLKQLAVDLKVSYDAIYNDYNIYSKQLTGGKPVEVLDEPKNIIKEIKAHEKTFISFIIYDREYLDYFNNELGESGNYLENEIVIQTYQAIVYFYNSLDNPQKDIYNYCYSQIKDNFVYDVMNEVTELISFDKDKMDKILNDCIAKFQLVKFIQELGGFEINSNEATSEVIETMNNKLKFVRNNIKKKRN